MFKSLLASFLSLSLAQAAFGGTLSYTRPDGTALLLSQTADGANTTYALSLCSDATLQNCVPYDVFNGAAVQAAPSSPYLWDTGTSNNGLIASALIVISTELNSLATSGGVISAGVAVSTVACVSGVCSTANTGAATKAPVVLTVGAIGSAVSAGGNVACWWLQSTNGSTFENTTNVPARSPDVIFPFQNRTYSAGEIILAQGVVVSLPALKFETLCQNNTGQTLASTGNTVVIVPTAMVH